MRESREPRVCSGGVGGAGGPALACSFARTDAARKHACIGVCVRVYVCTRATCDDGCGFGDADVVRDRHGRMNGQMVGWMDP